MKVAIWGGRGGEEGGCTLWACKYFLKVGNEGTIIMSSFMRKKRNVNHSYLLSERDTKPKLFMKHICACSPSCTGFELYEWIFLVATCKYKTLIVYKNDIRTVTSEAGLSRLNWTNWILKCTLAELNTA